MVTNTPNANITGQAILCMGLFVGVIIVAAITLVAIIGLVIVNSIATI